MMKFKLPTWCSGLLAALLLSVSAGVWAKSPIYTSYFSNVALSGYDTVAYFTEGLPVKGDKKYATKYKGAQWHFSSADNLALFVNNPTQYAPQYGGYCAWAAAKNDVAKGDPLAWTIYNDLLYINYDLSIRKSWLADIDAQIFAADANWPGPLE